MNDLLQSYDITKVIADDFRKALEAEMAAIMNQNSLSVAIPIESRTKTWSSVVYKVDHGHQGLTDVKNLADFVGLRLVFLLAEDVDRAGKLISDHFEVLSQDDKSTSLNLTEFGYKSVHYDVRFKPAWCEIPTHKPFSALRAEIQVRTLSQHNWAVASRILQYHQASAVPPSVRRSIHRLAALLEVVDLELDRVAKQKATYSDRLKENFDSEIFLNQTLDVDLLAAFLDEHLEPKRKAEDEKYASLFRDLQIARIETVRQLKDLLNDHLEAARKNDKLAFDEVNRGNAIYDGDPMLLDAGFFYGHVGLVRNMLNTKLGNGWIQRQPNNNPEERT